MIRRLVAGRRLVAAVLAVCGVSAVLAVGWQRTVSQHHTALIRAANTHIADLERVSAEIDETFVALASSVPAQCSRELLLRMRRAVAMHRNVQDILFFPLGSALPSCSAGLGMDHRFEPLPAPDPVPYTRKQRLMWAHYPLDLFDGRVESTLIKEGAFAVASNVGGQIYYPSDLEWETFYRQPDDSYGRHGGGIEGLYAAAQAVRHDFLRRNLYYTKCSHLAVACMTTHISFAEILRQDGFWLLLIPLRALVLAVVLYVLVTRLLAARGSVNGRIKAAIKRRRGFSCLYQPIVDIRSGEPLGCEVLARFADEFGDLMPDTFVPVVERLTGTWAFTEIIIERSMADLEALLAARPEFGVSINFYPQDLEEGKIPRLAACTTLQQAAERHYKLHFEVIETGFGSLDALHETIEYLHSRGFLISIDDFGTGASNLDQVHRLKADVLKIDRSFIRGLKPSNASIRSSLVPQIVEIARKVEVDLIAEGIEEAEQVQMLKALGVTKGQGYYYAKPLTIADLTAFVADADVADIVASI